MVERRPHRPYFFEVFAVLNLALITMLAMPKGIGIVQSLPKTLYSFGMPLVLQLIGGVLIRCGIAAVRGNLRAYWRHINTAGWWTDSLRLLFFGTMLINTYGWIKLTVPALHPRLFDRQLWDLDRVLFFGLSPNIFFLSLFSARPVLRVFDLSYAYIFLASMFVAFGFFLSDATRRVRVGFMSGIAVMWMIGAWLYMLVPSLGPAYHFPDVWFAYSDGLQKTIFLQATLMKNYQNFLRARAGADVGVNILYGIAAFPSLHVAFQMFVFLWFRRLWQTGQVLFAIFVLMIFLGSVITGWHYLVDSYAGLLLAVASYWPFARVIRLREWVRLRRAVAQNSAAAQAV